MAKQNRKASLLVPIRVAAKLVFSEEVVIKLIKTDALQSEWIGGTHYVKGRYLARLIKRVALPAE